MGRAGAANDDDREPVEADKALSQAKVSGAAGKVDWETWLPHKR